MQPTICPQCGKEVPQTGRGRPRRFCPGTNCAVDYWNHQKLRKYGNQAGYDAVRHMLSDFDPLTMTATCSRCGPETRVWRAGVNRVTCSNRAREQATRPHARRSNRESSWRRRGIDMTEERFDALVRDQGGVCAVCSGDLGERPHVDHCHNSGRVRGVTCQRCNRLMGLAGDDPERLRRAAEYLERSAAARPETAAAAYTSHGPQEE